MMTSKISEINSYSNRQQQ